MVTKIHTHMSGREVREFGSLNLDGRKDVRLSDLEAIGFGGFHAMDSALTGPSMSGGLVRTEFLQHVLSGVVRTATRVRVLDEIVGQTTAGNWHDEEIVLNVTTPTGKAELYGDFSNIPLASYIQDLEKRGLVRAELGFQVGKLEEARQGAAGFQAQAEKRAAVTEALEQFREKVGYFGFNGDDTRVFGLLNDPNLPAYNSAGVNWKTATFDQITADVIAMFERLEMRSGGRIKDDSAMTMVLPLGYRSALTKANPVAQGETVKEWIATNYPNVRFIFSPEFIGANGGADVAYLFADNVDDDSTATSSTFLQIVPVKYQVLGSENSIKGYLEDATNATAGIFLTRPWAVERLSFPA